MEEQLEEQAAESKVLKLTEFVTANELAVMMDVPVTQVISTCMSIGIMVSINNAWMPRPSIWWPKSSVSRRNMSVRKFPKR